jgi:hypothetical protein
MNRHNEPEASDFDGHGPTHRRGIRPRTRGYHEDDRLEQDAESNSGQVCPIVQQHRQRLRPRAGSRDRDTPIGHHVGDPEQEPRVSMAAESELLEAIIQLPYAAQACTLCLEKGTGHFLMPSIRNAVQHSASHHSDVRTQFQCTRCEKKYVNIHAAQCHIPKCPGPPAPIEEGPQCGYCNRRFSSTRGLSQHERQVHPLKRNIKRAAAATTRSERAPAKGHGSVWVEEELRLMIDLEARFRGNPRVAKEMLQYFPGKSLKQIRDKR